MQGNWDEIRFAYMDTEKEIGTCVEIWDIPSDYELPLPEKIIR